MRSHGKLCAGQHLDTLNGRVHSIIDISVSRRSHRGTHQSSQDRELEGSGVVGLCKQPYRITQIVVPTTNACPQSGNATEFSVARHFQRKRHTTMQEVLGATAMLKGGSLRMRRAAQR